MRCIYINDVSSFEKSEITITCYSHMYIYIFYIYIYIPIFYFKLKLKRCPHPGSDELLTSNIFLNSRFSNTLFLCFLCCHVFMFLCLMLFYSFGLIYRPNLKYRRWLEPPPCPKWGHPE